MARHRRQTRQIRIEAANIGLKLIEDLQKLGEGAHKLSEEAQDIARDVWHRIDLLPSMPDLRPIQPIRRQLYGHGAFMGAAPALLAEPRWCRILAFLMPDVYHDVSDVISNGGGPGRVIPMFENNPIMCAYGLWKTLTNTASDEAWAFDLIGVEWDLFIDGDLIEAFEESGTEALVEQLLSTAIIAHASTADTVQEALGFCQYADVRRTRKTRLGGLEIPAWLDIFARALLLAHAENPSSLFLEMAALPRIKTGDACVLHTFAEPIPTQQAIDIFRSITGRPQFSVVLEIKSLRSTPDLMQKLICGLNEQGIHVSAACSFYREEIIGLVNMQQHINGKIFDGPREVQFFHFAGDLQKACDDGNIEAGQSVLFNGASLLEPVADPDRRYRIKERVVSELAAYKKRHHLHIGIYVQEGDCDSRAASLLSDLIERPDDPFDLGFAWGGLREEVALQPKEGQDRMGYGSQRRLEMVGHARQWRLADQEE